MTQHKTQQSLNTVADFMKGVQDETKMAEVLQEFAVNTNKTRDQMLASLMNISSTEGV